MTLTYYKKDKFELFPTDILNVLKKTDIDRMKKFKKIYVEITNVCNLNCIFCPKTAREPQFMDIESFDKILKEIKPFTDYIYLHVKGEPLLHPGIDRILDSCQLRKFQVHLTTNGILLKEHKNKILSKSSIRQINISLHDFLHNFDEYSGEQKIKDYISDILDFIKEALGENRYVSLRLWNLNKDNNAGAQNQKNSIALEFIEKEYGLPYSIEDKYIPDKGIKIKEKLYVNYDYEFTWPDINSSFENTKGFCYGLREHIAILVDGTVVPCCLDGDGIIRLGNILEENLGNILSGKRAADIYNGFTGQRAVEPLCRKCSYKERFG